MRFLVVGLGSMGKRRVRNLKILGQSDIMGFDIRQDRIKEASRLGIKTFSTIKSALEEKPDIIIISTSPDTHLKYVQIATKMNIPFFTEVNTDPHHIEKIISLAKRTKTFAVSSMTMKFHPVSELIRKNLKKYQN